MGRKKLLSAPVQDIFSLCIIHWQEDSLLVCEAHQAAEVDTLSGSSSPSFWIPGMCWCGDMRAAGSHLESVTWEHGENVSEVGSVQKCEAGVHHICPSVIFHLFKVKSLWQQAKQGSPDIVLPRKRDEEDRRGGRNTPLITYSPWRNWKVMLCNKDFLVLLILFPLLSQ